HRPGLVPADQLAERLVQPDQPLLGREIRRDLDDAAVERDHAITGRADDAESGVGGTRIDADDDHAFPFSLALRMSFNQPETQSRAFRKEKGRPEAALPLFVSPQVAINPVRWPG